MQSKFGLFIVAVGIQALASKERTERLLRARTI